jgi:hypothetical protein
MFVSSKPSLEISAVEANNWWLKNEPAGILLNKLRILFIMVPIGLVFKDLYVWSFAVFSLMIPYGFFVRYLACCAVRKHLATNPAALEDFRNAGIVGD